MSSYVYNNYVKDWGQSTWRAIFYLQCDIEKFLNMENWRIPFFSLDTQCKRLTSDAASSLIFTIGILTHEYFGFVQRLVEFSIPKKDLVKPRITGWWFGTMEFYDFPYIWNFIMPTDFHILQRGWNHQPTIMKVWRFFIGDLTTGKSLKQGDDPQWSSVWFRALGCS